jgi:hypothetical protein
MKVVCIDASPSKIHPNYKCELIEGNIYTKIGELAGIRGILHYDLAECPVHAYAASRFIPLSTIDETEFERNYNKELV